MLRMRGWACIDQIRNMNNHNNPRELDVVTGEDVYAIKNGLFLLSIVRISKANLTG